nr:hypothetical protein Iba_chr05eCG6240 [Ipomoea batatas]
MAKSTQLVAVGVHYGVLLLVNVVDRRVPQLIYHVFDAIDKTLHILFEVIQAPLESVSIC